MKLLSVISILVLPGLVLIGGCDSQASEQGSDLIAKGAFPEFLAGTCNLATLGELIWDHCKRLEAEPRVKVTSSIAVNWALVKTSLAFWLALRLPRPADICPAGAKTKAEVVDCTAVIGTARLAFAPILLE